MRDLVSILIIGVVLLAGCASSPPVTTTSMAVSTTTFASTTSTTRAVTSTTIASSSTTQASSITMTSTQAPTTTQAAEMNIHISGFAFNPATLTVSKGATVTWINDDSATHTIVSDSGSVLSSSSLGRGDAFSHTFSEAGTFAYHCGIHRSMKGTIIVQ
jgi:plastocyanin